MTFEETGSELIALLKESEEIKINKPIYNRAQRKSIFQYALYQHTNEQGYISLTVEKQMVERKKSLRLLASGKAKMHCSR